MNHILELVLCTAALILGSVVYEVARAKRRTYAFVDGLVLVGVSGLVLFEILPRSFVELGIWAIPLALFGFVFPHFLEHRLGSLPVSPRTILSSMIILGLVIHQLLDGAGLGRHAPHEPEPALTALGLAIILHQVPKGFLLWEISKKAGGLRAALVVISGLVVTTAVGFFFGSQAIAAVDGKAFTCFQTFVAGGLLHVVVHHVSIGAEGAPRSGPAFWSGAGALMALALLAILPHSHVGEAEAFHDHGLGDRLLGLALKSAPPILLGLVAAGLIQSVVSLKSLAMFRGGNRLSSALRGIFLGIPLPICSCGVAPVYRTLVRRGVPAAAAIGFLIATPEIGVDSFFLSQRLLGTRLTLIRLGMAFLVALITALLLARLYNNSADARVAPEEDSPPDPEQGWGSKLFTGLKYACRDLIDDLGAWLIAGIAIAALVEPHLAPATFQGLPPGVEVVLFALIGLPMYVCASGATPLAAVLLANGASPGAVLAFLITGPTTNVTTFGLLAQSHGRRRALALPTTVFIVSVSLGWAINLLPNDGFQPNLGEHDPASWIESISLAIIGLLLAISVLRLGPRRFLGSLLGQESLGDHGSAAEGSGPDHHHHHHGHGHSHQE